MRDLKHKHVLEIIDVIENKEKEKLYLVIEFAGAGSLQQVMDSRLQKRLPISDVWKFVFFSNLYFLSSLVSFVN